MMAGIRATNTRPELILRTGLHRLGFRFRLHDRRLAGRPDIVFASRRAVIFAHGCFWHGHDCPLFRLPATRTEFWKKKIDRNRELDARASDALSAAGWRQAVVWECALKSPTRIPLPLVLGTCADWLRSEKPHLELRGKNSP